MYNSFSYNYYLLLGVLSMPRHIYFKRKKTHCFIYATQIISYFEIHSNVVKIVNVKYLYILICMFIERKKNSTFLKHDTIYNKYYNSRELGIVYFKCDKY